MRSLLISSWCVVFAGCTFGVKTCSEADPCVGGGQCVQGVCTILAGGGGGGQIDSDGGFDAGATGGGAGGGGGGVATTGGGGGALGGGGGSTEFDAGPLEGLVFLTPPRHVRAGECSSTIQVGVFQDAGITEDGGAAPLVVGSGNEETIFFEDNNCAAPVTDFVIPPSRVVSIYFKSPFAGSVLVNVSIDTVDPVSQVQLVVSAAPGRLAFGSPAAVLAGACSSALPVQVRDDFGNVASVNAPLQVQLSSDSNTTQFFGESDSSCQTPLVPATVSFAAGASSAFFRFRDPTPGLPVFAAVAPDAGTVGPASQEQTVF